MKTSSPLKLSVLILGSPRSGTTWLAKLFDSSESVLYRHEPDSVVPSTNVPFLPSSEEANLFELPACLYLAALANVRELRVVGSLPIFPKAYRNIFCEKFRVALLVFFKLLDKFLRPLGFRSKYNVPDLVRGRSLASTIVLMKSVNSLGRAKVFSCADKNLKVVHILRHPCGFVASQLRGGDLKLMNVQTFIETQAEMDQAKRRGLSRSVLESLSLEEQLESLWMMQNEKVMEEMAGNPQYKLVRYEDLCDDPLETLEALFSHTGVPMTNQVRKFVMRSQSGDGKNEKYFQIVRDTKKASRKWKEELDSAQISRIMAFVGSS